VSDSFPEIRFKGQLRPSQQDVVEIARKELARGERHLHIVAPPGSGKTVLGLFLWAECVRAPAVVFSPNSAIQAQWAARTDLFHFEKSGNVVSTDSKLPGLLTSLTYQSVTMPSRGGEELDVQAIGLWLERLVEKGQAKDPDEADVWIADLKQHNLEYYEDRLGFYRKEVRDARAMSGDALETLHRSSRETLNLLRERNVGLIILDECHHLMGHWGRVLADAREFLEHPIVVGLTATPPDRSGKALEDVERYDKFFGPVDYEVPVPAVVKDGFLAPYQDLAYFVRPTSDELAFIANADDELHAIVDELCIAPVDTESDVSPVVPDNTNEPVIESKPRVNSDAVSDHAEQPNPHASSGDDSDEEKPLRVKPLPNWLLDVLSELRMPTGAAKDWKSFENRDSEFALMSRLFLLQREIALPDEVPEPDLDFEFEQLPEMHLLVPVLDRYIRHGLRRSADSDDHKLAETAISRLRMLGVQVTEMGTQACASPVGRVMAYSRSKTAAVVPILKAEHAVLGDSIRAVIVSDFEKTSAVTAEVSHLLDSEAGGAIAAFKMLLSDPDTDSLDPVLVTGSSVLVDDDVADTLREHAEVWLQQEQFHVDLRYDEQDGFHVLNGRDRDWCPRVYVQMITELFQQGVTRCLVGTRGLLGEGWDANKINVLVDLTTVTTSMSVNQLRGRSIRLDPDVPNKLANNWDVVCIAPEFTKGLDDYERFKKKHKTLFGITDDGAIEKGVGHVHAAFTELKPEGVEGSVGVLNADMLERIAKRQEVRSMWKIGEPYHPEPVRTLELRPSGGGVGFPPFAGAKDPWSSRSLGLAIGRAILETMIEIGMLKRHREIHISERDGGYIRMFLEEASEEESAMFTEALQEAFRSLHRPRYVIPRHVDHYTETFLSKLLPSVVGKYFRKSRREMTMLHAVPSEFAKNKKLVEVYQSHWNHHVSPGEAVFAHRGEGEKLVEDARRNGLVPRGEVHEKDVFL